MQDYIFHVHRSDCAEPDVLEVAVRDDDRAEELARQRLGLSALNHTIDVWRHGRRLCSVSRLDG